MAGAGNPNRANPIMDMRYRGPGSVASPIGSDLQNAVSYGQPAGEATLAQPMLGGPAFDPSMSAAQGMNQRMVTPEPQPMQQSQAPNIFGTASQGMNQGIKTAGMETMYQPSTIAGTDMSQYMNPYEDQVVQNTMGDLDRQRQIQANQLGAQASARGAFGGSRDALMQSELSRNYGQQMANTSAQMRQAGYANAQQMAGQDIATGLTGSQNRQNAATTLGQLSNLGFGQGMDLQNQSMQQGALEQGINQLILDAGKGQFAGYTGAPGRSLGYMSDALGVTPTPKTTTETKQPGLFDYLTLGANTYGAMKSDINLKDAITKIGQLSDKIGLYRWKWNDKAKALGVTTPEVGVLAQEVEVVMPEAVSTAPDGYKQVRYDMVFNAFARG
jgi:hypothetical protein